MVVRNLSLGELKCKRVCCKGICPLENFCDKNQKIDYEFREKNRCFLIGRMSYYDEEYVTIYEKLDQMRFNLERRQGIPKYFYMCKDDLDDLIGKIKNELEDINDVLDKDAPSRYQPKLPSYLL